MTDTTSAGAMQRLSETAQLFRILTHLSRGRSDLVYNALSSRHVMGDTSLFINLGYWKNATTLDEASVHLADLLAREAAFTPDDGARQNRATLRVLDVGFGFGDQDIHWATAHENLRIDGINVTPLQVQLASERVAASGLSERIALQVGNAEAPPFERGTFDRVVALECAFHFNWRMRFFEAAHRVLRPGGRIALADFIAAPSYLDTPSLQHRVARMMGTWSWQIPARNLCGLDAYVAMLDAAGFHNIRTQSIAPDVFEPFEHYQRARFDTPEFKQRYHPLIRWMAKTQVDLGFLRTLDYVVVTGDKPS